VHLAYFGWRHDYRVIISIIIIIITSILGGMSFLFPKKKIFMRTSFPFCPQKKKYPQKSVGKFFFHPQQFFLPTFLRVFNMEKIDLRTTAHKV